MNEFKEKVAVGVVTELVKDSVKILWNKVKEYQVDLSEKDAIDFGYAYVKYLENAVKKVEMVKTIIYRKEPKDLYSIYEYLNIEMSGKIINSESVNNLLELGNKLIITGTAGMGKTTLLRHLFINSVKETNFIPIFVELRSVNDEDIKDIDILELIYGSLASCGFNAPKKYFEYSLEVGKYIILYDGFDEVKTEKNLNIAKGIRELSTKYPENYYIMSSRPMDQFIGWNDFREAETMALDKSQALRLIDKLEYDEVVKAKFLKALENGMFEKYNSFASNPLLLSIMLMTFNERAEIPDKLNDFYEQAFATLFNVHDGSKDCFKRDIKCGLGSDDFKTIFSYFCFKSYFKGDYQFTENSVRKYINMAHDKFPSINFKVDDYLDDLIKSVCMLVKDGLSYIFSHRSFQEYFAAYYTTKLIDQDQTKLINSWLSEERGGADDPYFVMLYNMQSDKFNKIILSKGLKKIKLLYKDGFTFDFLKKLFDKIAVSPKAPGDQKNYITYTFIKDYYLITVLKMSLAFNNFETKTLVNDQDFISYITDNRTLSSVREKTLLEIEKDQMTELVLKQYKWLDEQVVFGLKLLEKIERNTSKNKRKVENIIDSL